MPKTKKVTHQAATPKGAKASVEVQQASAKVANGIKKPGQTKEQTKLIEQGIQKGIELYKKQHKAKTREADKAKKKIKNKEKQSNLAEPIAHNDARQQKNALPWFLLIGSWLGFVIYLTV